MYVHIQKSLMESHIKWSWTRYHKINHRWSEELNFLPILRVNMFTHLQPKTALSPSLLYSHIRVGWGQSCPPWVHNKHKPQMPCYSKADSESINQSNRPKLASKLFLALVQTMEYGLPLIGRTSLCCERSCHIDSMSGGARWTQRPYIIETMQSYTLPT